ncbi:nucleoside-diphosphate kinase [candidate division TM6 bacterium RIFCSPHIGHO2_12_FULL_36_22]|nr:MAG: nucleoside-diphosphate kinase [candidate division TM6 bacterium RIFCSPHIGHO2_12_FULL_36_22]
MAIERTFAIIKPDAVSAGNSENIIKIIKDHGFDIEDMKALQLTQEQAKRFYDVHKKRPFFGELVEFMTSGPVVVMALSKENAVQEWRDLMGPTDSTQAPANTIRGQFGTDVGENATHGSDSIENAKIEIAQFFPELA